VEHSSRTSAAVLSLSFSPARQQVLVTSWARHKLLKLPLQTPSSLLDGILCVLMVHAPSGDHHNLSEERLHTLMLSASMQKSMTIAPHESA
jgi:hypothetical protein